MSDLIKLMLIPLTNSPLFAEIDDEDGTRVLALNTKWCLKFNKDRNNKPSGIYSTKNLRNNKKSKIPLHRFIMNCVNDNGFDVDHKDLNIFNNKKENLRIATYSQNHANCEKPKNNTSGHKNISFRKKLLNYEVLLNKNNRQISYGSYKKLEDAIEARNRGIKELHGEFSRA